MTTITQATHAVPSFRARLDKKAGSSTATVFMSGDLGGYDLDRVKESALYGVDAVRIDVDGVGRADAERYVASRLGPLVQRGVKVYVGSHPVLRRDA